MGEGQAWLLEGISRRRELVARAVVLRGLGWSQEQIAEELDVPRRTVTDWLRKVRIAVNGDEPVPALTAIMAVAEGENGSQITPRGVVKRIHVECLVCDWWSGKRSKAEVHVAETGHRVQVELTSRRVLSGGGRE
jgi:transcriptional regulator with XRE-family HTH domain